MRLKARLPLAAITAVLFASPALAANTSLDPITQSEALPAWQSTLITQVPTGPSNIRIGPSLSRATSTVRYDAATHSYIVRDTGSTSITSTFGPSNVVAAETNDRFTVYRKTSGSTTETFRLLNPGTGNSLIALTYTSYGEWKRTTPGAGYNGATVVNDTWFVFGVRTPAANMPRTGGATYSTVFDGSFVDRTNSYAVSGTGSLAANWANGTISYTANLTGTPASGPAINFNGPLTGTGSISFAGSGFTGKGSSSNSYKLGLSGYFFGPAANEVGAVFQLTGNNGSGTGAMVGKQ